MAIQSGGDFQLEVESAVVGVWNVVGDLHTFNNDIRRNVSNFPVFDKALPYRKVGKPDESCSADGYDNPADVGQARLNALADTGSVANIRVTRDGVSGGFTQNVLVTSRRYSSSADDESLQGRTYEFMGTTARVLIP